ncbi:methyltransferase family protein [Desulfoluna butyratoxydans]|uniref:Phospholipid methyltransferase n=1 Tax=Desulfoluna butyratoxydans TaxID=231438 RepID=A0A4U8YZM9_9BACT|nr:isoprenylcysteine carboxylmethyltransferase family protein [Desulfoluna butyratoxydans]VFQ47323.1 phospholipid methyltransferase [Desulfoluna butyratoxydans]
MLWRIFGVGPTGAGISLLMLGAMVWLDRIMGQPQLTGSGTIPVVAGCVLVVVGAVLHVLVFKNLTRWWVDGELCTRGPFGWCRHPMYAAWIGCIAPGIALAFNSWVVLFWPLAIRPAWHLLVSREEKAIRARFGAAYDEYAAVTPRFFPRWNRLRGD